MNRRNYFFLAVLALIVVISMQALSQSKKNEIRQISDLNYVDGHNYFQQLDLYLPPSAASRKLPLIVWIHGGAWRDGDKSDTPALTFAKAGYAVASLNYRLSDKASFPAQINDCKAAIRWLRAHADDYGLDSKKIGAFGMSAGGHLVALLGATNDDKHFDCGPNLKYSSSVQAVCDWCGPTDMFTLAEQAPDGCQIKWRGADSPLILFLGGAPESVSALAKMASPALLVKAGAPPCLIMHGDKDDVVPYAQSQELFAALKKCKNDVRLVPVKNAAHNFATPENLKLVLEFFDEKLNAMKN